MATQSPDKDTMDREFARMSGMLYDLNPRNFEARWYALVGIELNRLCRRIKCNAIATAQDSVWAGNTYPDPIRLANVVVKLGPGPTVDSQQKGPIGQDHVVAAVQRRPSKRNGNDLFGDPDDALDMVDTTLAATYKDLNVTGEGQEKEEGPATKSHTPHDPAPSVSQEALGTVQESDRTGNAQQEAKLPTMMQPYQPSMSARTVTGGNRHRVPDSAINGYVSIDFTLDEMKQATEERESWTTAAVNERRAHPVPVPTQSNAPTNTEDVQGGINQAAQQLEQTTQPTSSRRPLAMDHSTGEIHDELEKLPYTDPDDFDALINPLPMYRDRAGLIVEFKLLNAESKRLPSRQLTAQTTPAFESSLKDKMKAAQIGNLRQIRVFFASPHWDHQESVMLLATAGDFGTHTIATRDPKAEKPTFSIQPWSPPVWFGSKASQRREEKMIQWINETFSPEAMREIAVRLRDEAIRRSLERQKTPPEEDNADDDDGPTGPPGPPEPPADPKTRKRKRDPSNTEKPRRSIRDRTGNPYARTIAQNEHADAPPPVPPMPRSGDQSGTNHGRPAQDTANRAAAQPEPSGTPESASRAPPTRRTKSMPRLLGNNDTGNSKGKGKGKARADPVVENERTSGNPPLSLAPISETDEGAGANDDMDIDEDQPARKKARTLRPSEGPPSSGLSSFASDDEEAQPAASTSTAVQEPIGYTHTGRPVFPPPVFDASGKKASQKTKASQKANVSQKAKKKLTRSKTARN